MYTTVICDTCFFQYPVIAVDEWSAVTNPFTRTQHGHLGVLLAMGSEDQVIISCLSIVSGMIKLLVSLVSVA